MFDFPTTPAVGTKVQIPDGSWRRWDGVKWGPTPGPGPETLQVFIGDAPPGPPGGPLHGELWFNSYEQQMYIWYDDPNSSQWVIVTANVGGISEDAPHDGQLYGRQNGEWQNIAGGPYLPLNGGIVFGPTTFTGPLNYYATGTPTLRSAQDRAADVVNVKDFGAVFDGNSHPLNNYYPTLAAAQAVYPHAIALTDEIDGVAVQAAINALAARVVNYSYGGEVRLPVGIGLINQPLVINTPTISIRAPNIGFQFHNNYGPLLPSVTTKLLWTGAPRTAGQGQVNMLSVAATVAGNRMLIGCNIIGMMWDCNFVPGCAGPVFLSVRECIIDTATSEPNGVAYPGSVLTLNSTTITLLTSVGVRVGESIVSPSLPEGSYVQNVVDGVTVTASAQATATSTETVTIGGEGIRFDVVGGLPDGNATQFCRVVFHGIASKGAVNATAPLVLIGGSGTTVGAGGGWGNTSLMFFDNLSGFRLNGAGVVCNNSDHNFFTNINFTALGANSASLLVLNGSMDVLPNGGARFHKIGHVAGAGAIKVVGKDTGGFTEPSVGCVIDFVDRQNNAAYPTVGAGASARVGADNFSPALAFLGDDTTPYMLYAVSAHVPDGTILGGNNRGARAVDLQAAARTLPTQIASANYSVIGGGQLNTASGLQSVVAGGSGNTTSAIGATIPGGVNNAASQNYTLVSGTATVGDLFALAAHSGGVIAAGRRAQHNKQILRAVSGANTTPVRLTADGLAPSLINCCNLTYSDQCSALSVQLAAVDASAALNYFTWHQPLGLLRRGGTFGTATYVPGTPVILTNGTTAGIVITEAADTVNGGYSLTFTPPTGNSVIWRVVATVEWTRVDGA